MPLGRRMQPHELVGAAVYLASPSAGASDHRPPADGRRRMDRTVGTSHPNYLGQRQPLSVAAVPASLAGIVLSSAI